MITGKNHIGYQLSAAGTNTFRTFDPKKNLENPWEFFEAAIDEVDEAAQLASKALVPFSLTVLLRVVPIIGLLSVCRMGWCVCLTCTL